MNKIQEEIESRLFPVLDHVAKHAIEIDLQDLFKRFTYDNICAILMDYDPKFLSVDFPPILVSKAVTHIEEVSFLRHVMPTLIWKLLRWLGVGEKEYNNACKTLDNFIYSCIARKREQMRTQNEITEVNTDLLSLYMDDLENVKTLINNDGDKFLKDTILNFFIAGGDTTSVAFSWFFYLLSVNPQVIVKIREELKTLIIQDHDTHDDIFSRNFIENSSKLVYLHAALCEALRLYPPVAFNHKTSVNSDVLLASGHRVGPNTQIIFNMYAMGRMKCIWGDDCDEFKPERWISKGGSIKLEPTYKFLAFGAGPRICQGKDMVFTQMKAVVAAIIQKYDIEAVKGHQVVPDISVVLQMKHGFKVKLSHSQY
ncbi:hypothetical protein BVRB_005600 [Beta vulgaris subsp. vulgaris]|uniref:Cytochrome P450 n=2 Tax=Beta vulgaris subsp. vulgaris TaxID=3555 RepID=A0A0J8DXW5_BETVV|nr:hypothetical protein BVRB_005600 [Beta vulgaris subsp. vulgaris]